MNPSSARTPAIHEPARATPVRAEYDVLVAGGGPSGPETALAAAEDGLRVRVIEIRRIVSHYTMTQEDVLGCRHFEDAIAVASYPIDIHRPGDHGCTLLWCGDCYDITNRSLVPQKVENLLVAGRAAKLAVRADTSPAEIDVRCLQTELRGKGAYLREPAS